jgi:hypothetical protein
MKQFKIWLGLADVDHQPKETKPVNFKSTYPKDKLTFEQWCNEFRVSMLHGKHVRHFG